MSKPWHDWRVYPLFIGTGLLLRYGFDLGGVGLAGFITGSAIAIGYLLGRSHPERYP